MPVHSWCAYSGTSGQHPRAIASQVEKTGGKKTPNHLITLTCLVVLHLFYSFARVKQWRGMLCSVCTPKTRISLNGQAGWEHQPHLSSLLGLGIKVWL